MGAGLMIASILALTPKDYSGITIHLVGDSTMSVKLPLKRPDTGWGEPFAAMLCDGVRVINHARNGRSTTSYLAEGWWREVVTQLSEGDIVLIQFGHNDQKAHDPDLFAAAWRDYKNNLQGFVNETRASGAQPVLLTSIARRAFDSKGELQSTLGDYPAATRKLAKEMSVQLVDLNVMTREFIEALGPEASKALFLHLSPGVNANYIEGKQDDTHLNSQGALEVATMAAVELKKSMPEMICR